jgi:hypothetical protein
MSDRNLRRLAGKKNASDLVKVIHGLKGVAAGIQTVLPEHEQAMAGVSAAFNEFRSDFAQIVYEMERQRAVFMRMLYDAHDDGYGYKPAIEDLLARASDYSAEYDAMRFFCWLATLGSEEEP